MSRNPGEGARPHMRRPPASARYVIHQTARPSPDQPDGRWCLVDSGGSGNAETERMEASAEQRQAFTDERDPDGHHLFLSVTVAELREMGLGHLIGDKP